MCRAVPSPGLWKKYIDFLKMKMLKEIHAIKFREKLYGYKYSALVIRDKENKILYAEGIDTDPYLRAFFANMSSRPSCYNCQFKKKYRRIDFTIWDCFNIYNFHKEMDDDRGVSRCLIHTSKGEKIFDEIKESVRYCEIAPEVLTHNVWEMISSVNANPKRKEFFKDYTSMDISELFHKWYPKTWKTYFE